MIDRDNRLVYWVGFGCNLSTFGGDRAQQGTSRSANNLELAMDKPYRLGVH